MRIKMFVYKGVAIDLKLEANNRYSFQLSISEDVIGTFKTASMAVSYARHQVDMLGGI